MSRDVENIKMVSDSNTNSVTDLKVDITKTNKKIDRLEIEVDLGKKVEELVQLTQKKVED